MRTTPPNKAILLAAFGTVRENARKGFSIVDARVRAAHPGWDVAWAFTSEKVRRGIARAGQHADSVEEALDRLVRHGVTHLAVQSLHTAPGSEYEAMRSTCLERLNKGNFIALDVGGPLLDTPDDLIRAADGLYSYIPPLKQNDAVVLIGHGAIHEGHACYAALQQTARNVVPDILIGTLTGEPGIDTIVQRLRERSAQKVHLLPFLSVPGYHVCKDIAGSDPASWSSRIRAAGMNCTVRRSGIVDHPPFVDIWMEHLQRIITRLALPRCSA